MQSRAPASCASSSIHAKLLGAASHPTCAQVKATPESHLAAQGFCRCARTLGKRVWPPCLTQAARASAKSPLSMADKGSLAIDNTSLCASKAVPSLHLKDTSQKHSRFTGSLSHNGVLDDVEAVKVWLAAPVSIPLTCPDSSNCGLNQQCCGWSQQLQS
eukprot:6484298-Amphidinium_carterae.1